MKMKERIKNGLKSSWFGISAYLVAYLSICFIVGEWWVDAMPIRIGIVIFVISFVTGVIDNES